MENNAPSHSARIPAAFVIAALLELAAMFVMTWMRYSHQGLETSLLAFGTKANVYGFLLAIPFVAVYISAAFLKRLNEIRYAVTALHFSGTGLVILALISIADIEQQPLLATIYLAFKAIELATLIVYFGRRNRPVWRRILAGAIFSLLLIVAAYTFVISSVLLDPITPPPTDIEPRTEYDAGVILGAAVWSRDKPSPVLRERIRTGYDLLKNGTIEFIVLTGANAPNELTEAEVAKRELLKLGADPTRIVLEENTSSTAEQILFIRDELTKQGWKSFVIISDQFHLKRALEICAFNGIEANGIASESPLGPYNLSIYYLRESAALILYWMFGL